MTPLASRPGAPVSIYLDVYGGAGSYDGRTWNFAPYAGDVQTLWQALRDLLAPFDVNLTTAAPTSGKVLTCVVGHAFGGYPGGGVASVGCLSDGSSPMVFAFAEYFPDPVHLAYECAHEIGHAAGLDHQGQYVDGKCVNPYTPGAIMGNPHETPFLGWILGKTPAGVVQDDVVVLGRAFGFVLPGDLNFDKRVDIADVRILAGNYNKTGVGYAGGDLNGDGKVDLTDALAEVRQVGKTA